MPYQTRLVPWFGADRLSSADIAMRYSMVRQIPDNIAYQFPQCLA
ncbi:MAG: hypothetical protein OXD01_11170 [Gammaproteobacteria bacterium]|nr:hypothetical protein [Gammaproteobacteria bacterium]